jgi:hypothetical protein
MVQERPVRFERRLAAILAADVAGYSRLMHINVGDVTTRLRALRDLEPVFDGFLGSDPRDVPNSVAAHILAAMSGRTEVERTKARMLARQHTHNRKKRVSIVRRQRFGLLTR